MSATDAVGGFRPTGEAPTRQSSPGSDGSGFESIERQAPPGSDAPPPPAPRASADQDRPSGVPAGVTIFTDPASGQRYYIDPSSGMVVYIREGK